MTGQRTKGSEIIDYKTPADLNVVLSELMDCQSETPIEKAVKETCEFLEACLLKEPPGATVEALLKQDGIQTGTVADACCGHIFAEGELIYHCKECAMDETCVLCSRCFQAADHKGHDFRYYLSRGQGGSCDCGEAESWKMALTCPQHGAHSDGAGIDYDSQKMVPSTPSEERLFERALVFFPIIGETIKQTIHELANSEFLPSTGLTLPDDVPGCLTVINDEVHSFPEVISTFRENLLVTEGDAAEMAYIIDEQGFAVVGHFEANQLGEADTQLARIGATGLQTLLLSRETVTRLRSLHALLAFVLAMARKHPILKRCAIELISQTELDLQGHSDLLSLCFIHDNHMMKWFKKRLQELLTLSLASQRAKINLMRCFAHYAGRLVIEMIEMPRLDYTLSLLHFAVQVFTVPSIAELACQGLELTHLMAATRTCMEQAKKCPMLSKEAAQGLGMLVSILKYVLTNASVTQKGLLLTASFYAKLCDCLDSFSNFKAYRRRLDVHVLYDDEDIVNILTLMAQINELVEELAESVAAPEKLREMLEFVADYANCRMQDDPHMNTSDYFSFQQPLLWLIGALLERYTLLNEGSPSEPVRLGSAVVRGAARCVSMLCQIEAGMWVRNGRTVMAQGVFCMRHMATWREYMSICWHALASRSCSFSVLLTYLMISQSLEAGEEDGESLENLKYFKWLLEYAVLGLLYGMSPGLDSTTLIKAFLIRRLASGPAPYSEVMEGLPDSWQRGVDCGALLAEVASAQESETPFDPSVYRLRREVTAHFNMFSIDLLEPTRTTTIEHMGGTYGFEPITWILDHAAGEQSRDAQRYGLVLDSDEDVAGLQLLVNGIAKVLGHGQFFVDLVALLAYFQRHSSCGRMEIGPAALEHIYAAVRSLGGGNFARWQPITHMLTQRLVTFDQSRCEVETDGEMRAGSELALRKRRQVMEAFKGHQEQFKRQNPDAQLSNIEGGLWDRREYEMVLSGQCVYCQERADRDTEKYGVFGAVDTLNLYQVEAPCLTSCLHLIHLGCFKKLRAARRRQCPLCGSLGSMLFLVCPRPQSSPFCPDPANFVHPQGGHHQNPLAPEKRPSGASFGQREGERKPSEFAKDYPPEQAALAAYCLNQGRIISMMSGWVQQYYLLQRLGGAAREIAHLERIRHFLNAHEDALSLLSAGERSPSKGTGPVGDVFAEYLFRNYSCHELTVETYRSILEMGRAMVVRRMLRVAFPEEEFYERFVVDCAMVIGLVSLRFGLEMPSFDDCPGRLFTSLSSADPATRRRVLSELMQQDAGPRAPPRREETRLPLGSIFIDLPRDYQDLVLRLGASPVAERRKCTHNLCSHICLYCGAICCGIGHCSEYHTRHSCKSSHYHMFLNVRRCLIEAEFLGVGSSMPAPYVDRHGEIDMGFRRGGPLYLSEERWKTLKRIYISGGLGNLFLSRDANYSLRLENAQARLEAMFQPHILALLG